MSAHGSRPACPASREAGDVIGVDSLDRASRPGSGRNAAQARDVQRSKARTASHSNVERHRASTIAAGTPSCLRVLWDGSEPSWERDHGRAAAVISGILDFFLGDTLTHSSRETFASPTSVRSGSGLIVALGRLGSMVPIARCTMSRAGRLDFAGLARGATRSADYALDRSAPQSWGAVLSHGAAAGQRRAGPCGIWSRDCFRYSREPSYSSGPAG